jgi:hypothetical protein
MVLFEAVCLMAVAEVLLVQATLFADGPGAVQAICDMWYIHLAVRIFASMVGPDCARLATWLNHVFGPNVDITYSSI